MAKPILKNAFTLIELLIVIAIIGLLASIVLVATNNARAKARYAKVQEDFHTIRNAAEGVASASGAYPADGWPGSLPTDMSTYNYLTKWPAPPCPNWVYDWQNLDSSGASVGTGVNGYVIGTSLEFNNGVSWHYISADIIVDPNYPGNPNIGTNINLATTKAYYCTE